VWKHKGRDVQRFRAETAYPILKKLRFLATAEPWEGHSRAKVRGVWQQLCARLDVPWDAVKDIKARAAVQKLRETYPPLEFIRVEFRQVGPWTEQLDPLTTLAEHAEKPDKRNREFYDALESMPEARLDTW
jgi:hypothetical protein